MHKISGIYKIENLINHKVYIGQSKDIRQRLTYHKCHETNKHLKYAFEKYGIENFSFEILKETYDRDYWEIFLIQIYHSTNSKFGYNIENGGFYGSPIRTEEEREKFREAKRQYYANLPDEEKRRLAKEHSEKMKKRFKEKGFTEAEKANYIRLKNLKRSFPSSKHPFSNRDKNNGMFGRHRTEEEKRYLSKIHKGKKGKPHTEEHKNKIKGGVNPSAMKIQCVETKEIFNTCKEAFEKYNINNRYRGNVSILMNSLDKPTKTCFDYHWIRLTKRKRILCVETNKIYKSFSLAEKDTLVPKNTINQCCLGRREYAGIFHWKYID